MSIEIHEVSTSRALAPDLTPYRLTIKRGEERITPLREELTKHLSGQKDAKRSVATLYPANAPLFAMIVEFFFDTGLAAFAARTLGERIALMTGFSTLRKHSTDLSLFNPWHQDANFFHPDRGLTFWIPLEDSGVERPALTFVEGVDGLSVDESMSHFETVRSKILTDGVLNFTDEQLRDRLGNFKEISPVVHAGECLCFTPLVFHRTQSGPKLTKSRLSIEFRAIPAMSFPEVASKQSYTLRGVQNGEDGLFFYNRKRESRFVTLTAFRPPVEN
ncbi:MAG: phytanoyl-CoA dioxygenase family protein [Alphaproteobacteria bacterium]|nr:phytanoyl-CoA dioxygenase family protein [Alphaproteobacteria bacterium]